jgi:hypothetical protein
MSLGRGHQVPPRSGLDRLGCVAYSSIEPSVEVAGYYERLAVPLKPVNPLLERIDVMAECPTGVELFHVGGRAASDRDVLRLRLLHPDFRWTESKVSSRPSLTRRIAALREPGAHDHPDCGL